MCAFWQSCLDAFFPPRCVGCASPGAWLCADCVQTLPLVGRYSTDPSLGLDQCVALTWYAHPVAGALVRAIKYQRATCLKDEAFTPILQRFRLEKVDDMSLLDALHVDYIIPVPMDPERLRARGVDHAHLLAEVMQRELLPAVPCIDGLLRTRPTHTNASLPDAAHRAANLSQVFAVDTSTDLRGTRILLVDDVFTSGATLAEVARVLRTAGVISVSACVFATAHTQRTT